MAIAKDGSPVNKLKGKIGGELTARQWDGKTIVSKTPARKEGEPHPVQAARQEKFLLASRYAKAIMNDPDQSMADAYRELLKPRQNLYCRASEDFLSPPEVRHIKYDAYSGTVGDRIIVRAKDDFRVLSLCVEIYAADGTLIEAGEAKQNINWLDWTYTITRNNDALAGTRIKAVAVDVPGNERVLEVIL